MRRFSHVLVAGGGGFLGSALVPRLAGAGYEVTVVDRSPPGTGRDKLSYCSVDLEDSAATARALVPWRWDAVVNLAGRVTKEIESWDEGVATAANHVAIVANLRFAVPPAWHGRFVQVSGMVVYGMPERIPVTEEHPLRPIHHYGLAKKLAEDVVLAGNGLDRWVLRLPGLFAESRRSGALYGFVRAACEGRPVVVTATQPLPWDTLHVDDAVSAILAALESDSSAPGAVNVSYGEPMDLVDVARRFARRTGQTVSTIDGVVHPRFCLSVDKARRLFPWPPCDLDTRLEQLWQAWSGDTT